MAYENEANNVRSLMKSAGLLLIGVCIGFLILQHIFVPFSWYGMVGLQLGLYFLLGILHLYSGINFFSNTENPKVLLPLKSTLVLTTLLVILMLSCYFFLGKHQMPLALAEGAAFFFPSILQHSRIAFENIPTYQFKPWYKQNNSIEQKMRVFLASMPVKLRLVKTTLDDEYTEFEVNVSGQIELNKVFQYFIIEQTLNNVFIETENENGEPFGWHFYVCKLGGLKLVPLNPEINLWDSQITGNETIVIRRVEAMTKPKSFNYKSTKAHEIHEQ